jgi:hypothetical protein
MRPRIADQLKSFGCEATPEEFRSALADIKASDYADFTDEGLIVTRDEAGEFCAKVRKRLGAPRLTRPFILTALIGLRKNKAKVKPQTA